jgi:hypothetical protein
MIKSSVSAIMYLDCDTVKYPLALLWRRSMPDWPPWLTMNRRV